MLVRSRREHSGLPCRHATQNCRGKMFVCNTGDEAGRVGAPDTFFNVVHATQLIRRMHGGSQSILIRGEDERLYVVKLNNNQQGPNLLANEVLGSELLHAVGLPTPSWKPIFISENFIKKNPSLHFELQFGSRKVRSGIHFGSQFISRTAGGEVYDFLPSSFCNRIVNREDFLGIYIFDVWANHRDHRQAVFSTRQTNRAINAHFIDNGHLFGGPHWDFRDKPGAAMCLDRNLYTTTWQESDVDAWISRFETSIPQSLSRVTQQVPQDWYNGNIDELISCLLFRSSDLSNLFQLEVEHNQRIKILPRTGSGNASMPLRHSRSSPIRSIFGRSSFLVAPRC